MQATAITAIHLNQYANREMSESQVTRLYNQAPEQITQALQSYGYFDVKVESQLKQTTSGWKALFHIFPGEPVLVRALDITLPEAVREQRAVTKALNNFTPQIGERLDQAAYEKSKAQIQSSLLETGYFDAQLILHRIEVIRGEKRANILLEWQPGDRYRFGRIRFENSQFEEGFLNRYVPWREGDFYTSDQLLKLQQQLSDADYFTLVQASAYVQNAHNGIVPIIVMLTPAKRTVYTGGLFISTDSGVGARGSIERRWINQQGHKLKFQAEISQRLNTAAALYAIPLPGEDNRQWNLGINFYDERTNTSESRTTSLVVNQTREWRWFTQTLGLHLLSGNFQIAKQQEKTTLLYPEAALSRKQADDPVLVRQGYSLNTVIRGSASGLMADTSFAQTRVDAKFIRGIGENQRLILRSTLGATWVSDFNKLPPELRFFAGGDRSIRGYNYQTIGPRNDKNSVIGGTRLAIISGEYEYYFSPRWGAAVFLDSGDAFTGKDFHNKLGAGLGIRWRSPIGMVRVDVAAPLNDTVNHRPQLHIVIGPDL